ncbi:MAG: YraN family protein [Verrucomicrobiae bacterium]|nr:YraN family protein [Verrucomicrobiae bacterium]
MISPIPLIYRRFSRLLHAPCSLTGKDGEALSHIEIGDLGENIACSQLRADGRKVLFRNYRGPKGGEVDIVARDGDTLSFVEVKTRTRRGYGRPLDAVNTEKQELIERGANSWLHLLGTRKILWRFDVVEIILHDGDPPEVTVVNDVF